MARKKKINKTATKISTSVEKRIVEASLQNPDYGARRLVPLLEQEGITVTSSAVYTILKRNGLQNRSLRLSKLEEQHAVEMVPEPASPTKSPAETPESLVTPKIKVPPKPSSRRPWSLNPVNILLLGLVGYFWVSALGNFLEARREPSPLQNLAPVTVESIPQATVRSLEDYSIITERNLFGASEEQASARHEQISLEHIPAAEKDLGLKLVGTVAGDDAATSFAIIDNKTTRKQELYHEGDKAGQVLIKKILRNKVIVDAGRGEELLALELQGSGKSLNFSPPPQQKEKRLPSSARHRNLELDRNEVEASLANIDGLIQQVNLSPYKVGTQKGFRITGIPPDSVFTKLGLRSGDAILAINDQSVTGPEQAATFFHKIREGGDIEIRLRRRRRTMLVSLKIE